MQTGSLEVAPGGLDLEATLESGQTFLWERVDGDTYGSPIPSERPWYATTLATGRPVHVRARNGRLDWRASDDAEIDVGARLRHRLGLDHDLLAVEAAAPNDPLVRDAFDHARGLRLVTEPFFPTLVSFICSAQMRVERIFGMVQRLRERYGGRRTLAGHTVYTFPEPDTLAQAGESALRSMKLGYRAPYVVATAGQLASGELGAEDLVGLPYEDAREELTRFVGVGDKVADCVLLFALGYREAVPLDTWIRSAIEAAFPECAADDYKATSRAIRERLGGDRAGYAQTYVFHYLRTTDALERIATGSQA